MEMDRCADFWSSMMFFEPAFGHGRKGDTRKRLRRLRQTFRASCSNLNLQDWNGPMHLSQFHYLPLAPGFFSILVALFVVLLVVLIALGALRHAYLSLGVRPGTAMLLLLASLIGSYFNIPIVALPPEQVESDKVIEFFGMEYTVPMVQNLPGTVVAINVGGAVIPTIMSLYLLSSRRLWVSGTIATAIVALVLHWLANPVPGVGIAVPIFVPAIITAVVALLLSRYDAAPLAYISGSMGTLIGADLTNLDKVAGLGAPVASIGGAGTFDGIFLTGILAVLLAGLYRPNRPAAQPWA
jgi:uncharacterized membrane protein